MAGATDFFEKAEPLFQLYEQGKYAESLAIAEQLRAEYPDRDVHTTYWRMCLYCVMGQKERALQIFEEALDRGLWWAEGRLRAEPDLEGLHGNPEFERLVSICAQRHESAKGQARPELVIMEPEMSEPALYPLLMIFHGRDGSADREKHQWKSARDLGWLVALAQSSQVGSLNSYVWDDVELSRREIREHFKVLQEKYPLDVSQIVLGGFSQGSGVAMLTSLIGDIPATAFIAVAPGGVIKMDELPALVDSAKGRGLHGLIVAGGKDPSFDKFNLISETLTSHGIPCQLEIRAEMGHAYPPDFKELLESTLRSVSSKEKE